MGRIARAVFFWWATFDIFGRVCRVFPMLWRVVLGRGFGGFRRGWSTRVLQATNEELAGVSNVYTYVRVHSMLAQHVYPKFLAGLGETPERVQGEHVGKDASSLVPMYQVKELVGDLFSRIWPKVSPLC